MDTTMAAVYVILFLLNIHTCFTYYLEEQNTLHLPREYHIKGEIADLIAGLDKPFEAWHSEEKNKSRIDVYNGLVKTYYHVEDEEMATEYTVHPATTEEVTNEIQCNRDYVDDPPKMLPSSENFTLSGEDIYNGKVVQVWTSLEIDMDEKRKDVLYVYRNEEGVDVPVWREIKVYNEWTSVTSKHKILLYFDYNIPNEDELDVAKVKECEDAMATPVHDRWSEEDVFHGYKMKHERDYKGDEHGMRKSIFKKSLRRVIEHNKQNLGYKLAINKFSDRTDDELAYLLGTRPSDPLTFGSEPFPHSEKEVNELVEDLPDEYDMRIDGLISVIKNQDSCGSCWSFATVATIEGALARVNGGRDLDLSEQSLVDCSWGFTNMGCGGGFISETYKYVLKHGIPMESDYGTYLAADGNCSLRNMSDVYRIKGFARVPAMSVNAMKVALYKYGPVTVTINATPLKDYSSGVFYNLNCNSGHINHAVTVVGYGKRDSGTYWIVKNSWGEDWGQDGYILLSSLNNNCHLLEDPFYPIV